MSARTVERTRRAKACSRRVAAVGGVLLGASGLAVGGPALPAAASDPTADLYCLSSSLELRIRGFPPSERLRVLAVLDYEDTAIDVFNVSLATDATGAGAVGGASLPTEGTSVTLGVVLYRDGNGNLRWDPDTDDTIYRGEATTDCSQFSVPVAPK